MRKLVRYISRLSLMFIIGIFGILTIGNASVKALDNDKVQEFIQDVTDLVGIDITKYFDTSLVYQLPSELEDDEIISVIVELNNDPLYDVYAAERRLCTYSEFVNTKEAKNYLESLNNSIQNKIDRLDKNGIQYELGEIYTVLLTGFEISIKAGDFRQLSEVLTTATLVLGETYAKCETEVVTNDVDVYETGIFDSSMADYQGDGVVIAVLDTGLDYTHTAFSVENFTTSNAAFTLANVSEIVGKTKAATFTSGLTGEDVYLNEKVPYAYDYADKDADVAPINSEHGTHVAGIIAGKDDTITGVAPNAQLAIFKVFSDHQTGAKSSWIIAALEDCVTIGVDVINMSLGSPCGFTREVDKEAVANIYQKVYDSGIELIASAANQYTATQGSTKNGNNALTSNLDYGTVGAPSTYEAALSVASVNGEKTSYLKVGNQIIYFNEAYTNSADVTKSFVNDILDTVSGDVDDYEFEYVVIPGVGRSSDYPEDDSYYEGKIVLVKRGQTTFEDKVRVALKEKGASGIIIYNNVSGTISMSVGANIGAVCSVSQDDGEYLVSQINKETGIGKITVSRSNVAGPFMSDFSSWGPTSDLRIKPEITAHGGNILSAVPGQGYEKLSGTSMAAPNLTGAAALIIQYVKYSGIFGENLSTNEVTDIVNQLMMSTADIIYDKNGLPSSIRKQGAGLISISKSTNAESYISTYDKNGNKMDKAKIELGDDKNKTGVYTMTVDVNNISNSSASYTVGAIVLTEGVATTYTSHGETTITQNEYLLDGASISVTNIENGTVNGNNITVNGKTTAKVTLEIKLSDKDKKYLNDSFENGSYVEGYVTLTGNNGTKIDLNVPFLAFYGDWTQAPIFDEEYYDTHKDEINKGLDDEDKLMADATPTRVIGGLYSDYISTLGVYYFNQNPANTQIAASKEHIAVSNQNTGSGTSTISSIRSINAGLLRNAKEIYVSIVEDSTGKEIYNTVVNNQRKSYSSGSTIYASSIDIDYSIIKNQLKNNTSYTCTLTAYIDYGTHEEQNNIRNTFSFPFYVDFEAPIITGVTYRTEYDKTTKTTKLFADVSVYDNHYAMAMQLGQITKAPEGSEYAFSMNSFGKYMTPVYSSYNSTSVVTLELTDYVSQLKNSCGIKYNSDGTFDIDYNNNSYIVTVYDYAMNNATYEIKLPDEIVYMCFNDDELSISPNETIDISDILSIYPTSSWVQVLDFESSDTDVVSIVNTTIIGKKSGVATVTASGYDENGNSISASVKITVLKEGDPGYVGNYSIPEVNKFTLDGYKTLRAYYFVNSDEREIGTTNGEYDFGDTVSLSMYPSEQVELKYTLDSYFPESASVTFKVSNSKIASVDENGVLTALAKGNTTVMISVLFNGKSTLYSAKVALTVKDPYKIQSIYLMGYYGLGGEVTIPADRGITTIYSYAFCHYEYVEKDLENGDVIDEEDPYYIKQFYIGDDSITKIIIPEGVTTIESYAFANLTALEEVVLPSTLNRIGVGAFYNCTSLKKINLDNVQFINEKAFYNCPIEEVTFNKLVSVGTYAFMDCTSLNYIVLPECAQSLSDGAFYNCSALASVTLKASKIKLGNYAFANCSSLQSININATVISSYAFYQCSELSEVTLGADVSVIGEYAFSLTNVSKFNLSSKNKILSLESDGALVLKNNELILAAPNYVGAGNTITTTATSIGTGAFAGNKKVFYVNALNVTTINDYAFADCSNLISVNMPNVEVIGKYAFANCDLNALEINNVKEIGDFAFAGNRSLEALSLADNVNIGRYAFAYCISIKNITVGNDVTIGEYAFYCPVSVNTYDYTSNFNYYTPYAYQVKDENGNVIATNSYYAYNFTSGAYSSLKTLTAGDNLEVKEGAFFGNAVLKTVTLGNNANIGNYAFYSCASLDTLDFTKVTKIGDYAFAGYRTFDYWLKDNTWNYAFEQEYDDGVFTNTAYKYSCFAPSFTSIDLTNVTELGLAAFMGNTKLTSVTLSITLDSVKDYAFANCSSLESINLTNNITSVGEYAFYSAGLKNINLENIDTIGKCAFYNTKINDVTFKDGVKVDDQAFYYVRTLSNISNAENISYVGAYAFTLTKIETIDLENCTYIGDFAFSHSSLMNVKLGSKLVELGENPFYGCDITSFGKVSYVTVGKNQYSTTEETYDLNENIKVINGVLYQVIPTGLELVSYPMSKSDTAYTVAEGTTRVSAAAFAYAKLQTITFDNVLKSIGDKAMYGCEYLEVVVFTSYDAPKLEETYSENYANVNNLPLSGYLAGYEGLGISNYYMWNVASNKTNFYYGATFKDYIGHATGDLVVSKPVNGQNYDSFIFHQYFKTFVDGAAAATLDTLGVIKLINSIPSNITLSSEPAIVAAREAYNNMTSTEQQALVTNYTNLVKAESTLTYLKNRENNNEPIVDPEPPIEEKKGCNSKDAIVVALVSCSLGFIGFTVLKKREEGIE